MPKDCEVKKYTVLVEGHCLHTREYILMAKDEARAKKIALALFGKEDNYSCDYSDVVEVTETELDEGSNGAIQKHTSAL